MSTHDDWSYVGDSPDWPEICISWQLAKRYFINETKLARSRGNDAYARMCLAQALHYGLRIRQRCLFPLNSSGERDLRMLLTGSYRYEK